jgi:predicted transcriptional regulator
MSHLHKNLDYLMRRQSETQTSVAEFVGVTQPAVGNWLRDTMPRSEQIEKIAQLFEVTVDDLVNNELPHRTKIDALTELERQLKELKASWDAVAKRLKESAARSAAAQDYSNAVQNDWMGSGIESCANDLSKILEGYFPEQKATASSDQQTDNTGPPPASV